MNVVTCTTWVKRGVAAAEPEKVKLTAEELEAVIQQTQSELQELLNISDEENVHGLESSRKEFSDKNENNDTAGEDEYNFDKYDGESTVGLCHFGSVVVSNNDKKDPYITVPDENDSDSEKEDDIIKPDDNLLLVSRVYADASILEVYVYNENEGSFYCHHDILLSGFPLCTEWLNFDPSDSNPGNLCAIGSMSPIIEVWDLDIINSVEPAFKLGRKANRKKRVQSIGHRNAVLDVAWNSCFTHILASGSADRTVLLWDLENGKPAKKMTSFNEKVQSIKWHPIESSTLLTGSADTSVKLFDCNAEDSFKSWQTSGEVEKVVWDYSHSNICYVGTNVGCIECIDIRKENQILWQQKVDEKEITGLCTSTCSGMLVACTASGLFSVWDVSNPQSALNDVVYTETCNLGSLQCLAVNPDNPFAYSLGGDNKAHNLQLINFMDKPAVLQRFQSPSKLPDNRDQKIATKAVVNDESMDVTEELSTLTVNVNSETCKTNLQGKKKKKSEMMKK